MFDFKRFIYDKKLTQTTIASALGVKQSYVSRIAAGMYALSEEHMRILEDKYGDISAYYDIAETTLHNTQAKDYSLVPLYNMDARGGFGTNDEVDTVEYIQDYMPFKNAKQGDICVPVTGKSMLPTYYPGSIILLHEIECWRDFLEMGQVYVIILTDGRRLLKELRHSLENRKTHILCVSHNPEIQDSELPTHMIYKVFLVTALYQKTTM